HVLLSTSFDASVGTASHPLSLDAVGPQRYLHSFPTRRSSDLQNSRTSEDTNKCVKYTRKLYLCELFTEANWRRLIQLASVNNSRSEEHTSELQSRFELVCRLLLEKKKQLASTMTT